MMDYSYTPITNT